MTDQELIAAAAQAAVQAVMQMGAAPAPSAPAKAVEDADNEGRATAEEVAEVKQQEREAKAKAARAEELAAELVPLLVRDRHLPIFKWMRAGSTDAELLKQILANTLAKMMTKWREANGQISASSTDVELLTNHLPGKQ